MHIDTKYKGKAMQAQADQKTMKILFKNKVINKLK